MTDPDGTRRGTPPDAPEPREKGVDPTVRFVTWHATVTALATLGVVFVLALVDKPAAAVLAGALGGGASLLQVHFHPQR